jgi:hypothetical protein
MTETIEDYFRFHTKDAASAERFLAAADALLELVLDDPRVDTCYRAWRRDTGIEDALVALQATPGEGSAEAAFLPWWARAVTQSAIVCPRLVTHDLRLPYPWLAVMLSTAFLERTAVDAGVVLHAWIPWAGVIPAGQRGRRATRNGDIIKADVRWFYRAKVQDPPESIRKLGQEYAEQADTAVWSERTEGRSAVQAAIKRAKELLDSVEYAFAPLPK